MKCYAIVLAAGSGSRMGSSTKKQFISVNGVPLICYSLKAVEESFIDGVILVASKDDLEYCRENIVDKYGFKKVISIVEGGKERCDSVLCGLRAIDSCDYVFIHDGARPMIDEDILKRCLDDVEKYKACVCAVKSKDTIKTVSEDGFVSETPDRESTYVIQTPQVFEFELIKEAYENILKDKDELAKKGINITDDAMVLETYKDHPIKITEGSYSNIKVTTPEDLILAKSFLKDIKFTQESDTDVIDIPEDSATAYVDGSFDPSTNRYSYGTVIFTAKGREEFCEDFSDEEMAQMRNVAGEIEGSMKAMRYCVEEGIKDLTICYDYEGIAAWPLGKWKTNKKGTIAYKEYYESIKDKLKVTFIKVKGHSGDKYNDLADSLAKKALGI